MKSIQARIVGIRKRYKKIRKTAMRKRGLTVSDRERYSRLERWAVAKTIAKYGDPSQRRLAKVSLRYKNLAMKAGKSPDNFRRFDALEQAAVMKVAGKSLEDGGIVLVGDDRSLFNMGGRGRLIGISGPIHESEILALEDSGKSVTDLPFENFVLATRYTDYEDAIRTSSAILSNIEVPGNIRWYWQY